MDEARMMKHYENEKKKAALGFLTKALAEDGKWFKFELLNDGRDVCITDIASGNKKYVNINMDNIPTMLFDILRQGKEWLF